MSTWYNITEQADVDYNPDDDTIEVYIGSDYNGSIYTSIPVGLIEKALELGKPAKV